MYFIYLFRVYDYMIYFYSLHYSNYYMIHKCIKFVTISDLRIGCCNDAPWAHGGGDEVMRFSSTYFYILFDRNITTPTETLIIDHCMKLEFMLLSLIVQQNQTRQHRLKIYTIFLISCYKLKVQPWTKRKRRLISAMLSCL